MLVLDTPVMIGIGLFIGVGLLAVLALLGKADPGNTKK